MMGVTPPAAVQQLSEWGVWAIGANCGNGVAEIEQVIDQMHRAQPEAILIAKSNAGIPQWIDNRLVYDGTPAVMGRYAQRVRALGARLIGGCCGNGPDHIRAMAQALAQDPEADELFAADEVVVAQPVVANGTNGEPKRRRRRRR